MIYSVFTAVDAPRNTTLNNITDIPRITGILPTTHAVRIYPLEHRKYKSTDIRVAVIILDKVFLSV